MLEQILARGSKVAISLHLRFYAGRKPSCVPQRWRAIVTADRVLFLDSDIELAEHALGHLLADAARNDNTITMADVVHPPASRLTLATHLFDVPRHFRDFRREQAKGSLTWKTFTSCAFIMHRAAFERIGGFT